ncbi:MAG: alpha/beta hydrolase [Chitinophagaceae bacterium]|nr:MAG: alpha/beta hydrolase [Chitinophagaceae bacterium]
MGIHPNALETCALLPHFRVPLMSVILLLPPHRYREECSGTQVQGQAARKGSWFSQSTGLNQAAFVTITLGVTSLLMRNLILLHGALGAPETLEPLATALTAHYQLHLPAFPGRAGVAASGYNMSALVGFLSEFITDNNLERPLIFGYSMGGYAALTLASRQPGLLGGVATLATKLHWSADAAAAEARMLDPDKLEAKVPAFAATLARRHAPLNWKDVMRGTATLMTDLGNDPLLKQPQFKAIADPVLLLLGDRDSMVSLEETREAWQQIPGAQLGVLPNTPHPIEKAPVEILSAQLHHFYRQCNL